MTGNIYNKVIKKTRTPFLKILSAILCLMYCHNNCASQYNNSNNINISPIVNETTDDSSRVTFLYKETGTNIKAIRVISDLVPYFTNGINTDPDNTAWLTKNLQEQIWTLTITISNKLRIPYRYEITVNKNGKDSLYEILDPMNKSVYLQSYDRISQSILSLKKAFPFYWTKDTGTVKWRKMQLRSEIQSKNTDVYIYHPNGYDLKKKSGYPAVIMLGSYTFGIELETGEIYRNLYQKNEIVPALIALIDYKAYNTVKDFDSAGLYIIREVLPFLQKEYNVSNDPSKITLCGISRRGVVASYIALTNDSHIKNVISLSGGFSWKPFGNTEYEWFSNLLATDKKRNINFYLSAGNLESVVTANNAGHYILAVNRHLRNILQSKKYLFKYEEIPGGHNALTWPQGLYNGLRYFLIKSH